MRIVIAEIRRFLARRAVVLLLVLGFVLTAVITGATMWDHRPVGAADVARAEQLAQREAGRSYIKRDIARCETHPNQYRYVQDCSALAPSADQFLDRSPLHPRRALKDTLPALTTLLALLALLAGTSFIGADFSSGSMSNLLLFEPRRGRVWLAKILGSAVVLTASAVITLGAAFAALVFAGLAWSDASWTGDQWWHNIYFLARAIVLVVAAGLAGAAMTLALRSTIATVGAVLGYLAVGETLLRLVVGNVVNPGLLSHRVLGFLLGRFKLSVYGDGRRPDVWRFFLQPSAIYLAVLMAVVFVGSYAVFRRRDVT